MTNLLAIELGNEPECKHSFLELCGQRLSLQTMQEMANPLRLEHGHRLQMLLRRIIGISSLEKRLTQKQSSRPEIRILRLQLGERRS